ncbi:hypothetical protein [Streptomyces sp. NBC_01716]|uniref:hypothetical protein n=1 Tax=Streptomyces sp. NBC_01716 TaxID=2975917 RepID=UPI002E368D64|nr:hypothetical protein [Streptomyces sp. NBC_01716]
MADSSVWFGVLGALGGAGVAGLAAVYGPLRLHRRQVEQKDAEKLALWREGETARLLLVRVTGRAWIDALERTVQDLEAGRPMDLERYDDVIAQVSTEAHKAGISLAFSGAWVDSMETLSQSVPIPPGVAEGDIQAAEARARLLAALREATRVVRAEILRRTVRPPEAEENEVSQEVADAMERSRVARATLNDVLSDEISHVTEISPRP